MKLVFSTPPEIDPGTLVRLWGTETAEEFTVSRIVPAIADTEGFGVSSERLIPGSAFASPKHGRIPRRSRRRARKPDYRRGQQRLLRRLDLCECLLQGELLRLRRSARQGLGPLHVFDERMRHQGPGYGDEGQDDGEVQPVRVHHVEDVQLFVERPRLGWGRPTPPRATLGTTAASPCVVVVQEPGHNFGMQHSSSMACGSSTFVDNPDGTCTHSEYGDPFDPMGGGCRHMNVWQKNFEGWFGKCNNVTVNESGTFNLLPTEVACDGIQALQIPMPKARQFTRPAAGGGSAGVDPVTHYYLEYRTSQGFDSGMSPRGRSPRRTGSFAPGRNEGATPGSSTCTRGRRQASRTLPSRSDRSSPIPLVA